MKRIQLVSSTISSGKGSKTVINVISYASLFDARPHETDTTAKAMLAKFNPKKVTTLEKYRTYARVNYSPADVDMEVYFAKFETAMQAVQSLVYDDSTYLYNFACNMFTKVKRQRIASYARNDGGDLLVIDNQDIDDCVNDMYLQMVLAYRHMLENKEVMTLGRYKAIKSSVHNAGDDIPYNAIVAKALTIEIREAIKELSDDEKIELSLLKLARRHDELTPAQAKRFWHLVNQSRTVLKDVKARELESFGDFLYVSNILCGMVYDVYIMRKRRTISTLSALHDTANKYGIQRSDDGMIELNTVHNIMDARTQKLADTAETMKNTLSALELVEFYKMSIADVLSNKEVNTLYELLAKRADDNTVLSVAERKRLQRLRAKIVDFYNVEV